MRRGPRILCALSLFVLITPPAARAQDRLEYDFHPGATNLAPPRFFGPNVDAVVQRDGSGLRFTLPEGRKNSDVVGVDIPLRVHGDFEVVIGYELLAIAEPTNDRGSGVQARLYFNAPVPQVAMMSRVRKVGKESIGAFLLGVAPDGADIWPKTNAGPVVAATATTGKFRLVRTGPRLTFTVADGPVDYKPVFSPDVGTEDVTHLRLLALSGYRPTATDVRFSELVIVTNQPTAAAPPAVPAAEPPPVPRRRGPLVVALLVFAVILVAAVALALIYLSRKSKLTADAAPKSPAHKPRPKPHGEPPPRSTK